MDEPATLEDLEHLLERGVQTFFLEREEADKSTRRLLASTELFAMIQVYWQRIYDLLLEGKERQAYMVLVEISKFIKDADELDRLLQEGVNEFQDLRQVDNETLVSILVPVVVRQLEMSSASYDSLSAEASYLLQVQKQVIFPLTQNQDS